MTNDHAPKDRLTDRDRALLERIRLFAEKLPVSYKQEFIGIVYDTHDRGVGKGALHDASEYRSMDGTLLTELERYKKKVSVEAESLQERQPVASETH